MGSRQSPGCIFRVGRCAMGKSLDGGGNEAQSTCIARLCDGEKLDGPCGAEAGFAYQAQLAVPKFSAGKAENLANLAGDVLDPAAGAGQLCEGGVIRELVDARVFQSVRPDFK